MQSVALRLVGKRILDRGTSRFRPRGVLASISATDTTDPISFLSQYSSAAAAAVVAASAACVSRVACEEGTNNEGDDPYDNMPEEDEPTHCSICQINRQGPCRPYWRKFERCMKDQMAENKEQNKKDGENGNDGDDDDDNDDTSPLEGAGALGEKCDKYMMPWITCFSSNRDCYNLLTNKFYQKEYIDPTEASVEECDKRCWVGIPDIDWHNLAEYFSNKNDDNSSVKSVLCDCQARLPLVDVETNSPIEVAYVRDQDGKILGFDMFTSDKKDGKDESFLTFSVPVGKTLGVTIFAIYQSPSPPPQEDENTSTNDDDSVSQQVPQRIMYSSRRIIVPYDYCYEQGVDEIRWQELENQCGSAFEQRT